MGTFWQGFGAGVIVVLLPSLIYLAVLVQRARDLPGPPFPQEAEGRDEAKTRE